VTRATPIIVAEPEVSTTSRALPLWRLSYIAPVGILASGSETRARAPVSGEAVLAFEHIPGFVLAGCGFHSGTSGIGAEMPGGGGVRLEYCNPMAVDDVPADVPERDVILAHPSFPWQDEALAIATHMPNVYIDLSGWSPKYFPENLVR
jgi:hypothetical protein